MTTAQFWVLSATAVLALACGITAILICRKYVSYVLAELEGMKASPRTTYVSSPDYGMKLQVDAVSEQVVSLQEAQKKQDVLRASLDERLNLLEHRPVRTALRAATLRGPR